MAALTTVKTEFAISMFKASLKVMGLAFRLSPRLRKEIFNPDTGYVFNASYQFKTRDDKVKVFARFQDGALRSGTGEIEHPDVTIFYKDKQTLAALFNKSPEESLDYILTNDMSYSGKMSYLTRFSYLTTVLKGVTSGNHTKYKRKQVPIADPSATEKRRNLKNECLNRKVDNVQVLGDPYLGSLSLQDFPRLQYLKYRRYSLKPSLCVERARLVTEYYRKYGFETDSSGRPRDPVLRQAEAVHYLMVHKKPRIYEKDLLAGSTTSKELGVPIYPELIGLTIWPELRTVSSRALNPYDITKEEIDILNYEVFPYWMDRNVREYCRTTFHNPVSQQLEEHFVLYFMMKNNAISHTVPDFRMILTQGLDRIKENVLLKLEQAHHREATSFYQALKIAIDGVLSYAKNLSNEALRIAATLDPSHPTDAARIAELKEIARICDKVPAKPAETVHEALMAIWICFTCLHLENANSALSIGRLDQLLNPFFLSDVAKATHPEEKEAIIRKTIELVGCFFLKLNDHEPMVPNVGNKLFSGTSSDDTVTVGGVDRNGNNAVCDMTYIILKVAEMIGFQDPNMNARYYPGINSREYLRRLCEVNINMKASPSIHNDQKMIEALVYQGIPIEDARDWAATGCVEPTISGKHFGHTNCMLLNMVAPLEMALHNGVHPLVGKRIGPATGDPRHPNAMPTFRDFFEAYKVQLSYLAEKSIEINNYLGYAHQYIHPTPLLSAMMTGPLDKGKDVVHGGAVYNTSGVALVSLTDVVDSLLVIKHLIYEKKSVDFSTLLDALESNFEGNGYERLHAAIQKVPKFGSDSDQAHEIAQEIIDFVYDLYHSHENYRGGIYLPGYWSISFHVGFGMLSGALPSGRKKGKPFTPGLTPAPGTSNQLIQNIHQIARLNHLKMPNNIAFNVKLVPYPDDPHSKTLDIFSSYVGGYFEEGGMQWQFNVISSATLRDAMEHPEDYRWLIVRISGYNAYFVNLNRNTQLEIIERTEYCAR